MIEISQRQIRIDGEPRIVMAGEVHYFRVARAEWGQRLDLLLEAGCDTVASYIPWICHELPDGTHRRHRRDPARAGRRRVHRPRRRRRACAFSPGPGRSSWPS